MRFYLHLLVLLLVVLWTEVLSAAEPDVEAVDNAAATIRSAGAQSATAAALSELAQDSVRRVCQRSGFDDLVLIADLNEKIDSNVKRQVKALFQSKLQSEEKERSLFELLRTLSGDDFVHAFIARDFQLSSLQPQQENSDIPHSLVGQGNVRHADSGLRSELGRIEIAEDLGGPGSSNGILDAGEWVRLKLWLKNPTTKPYFSTSFWGKSNSDCLWVDEFAVDPAAEMDPGTVSGEASLWVYLSNNCPAGTKATLTLNVQDSHRTKDSKETIYIDLLVSNRNGTKLLSPNLDADDPGFSSGSNLDEIVAGELYEFSTGIEISGGPAKEVKGRYVLPNHPGLIVGPEARPGTMFPRDNRRYDPYDDLDFYSQKAEVFSKSLARLQSSRSHPSFDGEDNRLWGSFDAIVTVMHPGPPIYQEETEESPPPKPIGSDALADLIREFVSLVPRPAKPLGEGAIKSTDGYELNVEWDALLKAYQAMTTPSPPPPKKKERQVETSYRYRLYFSLPVTEVEAVAEDCNNGKDDDLDGLIDRRDPDCVESNCDDGIDNDGDGAIDQDDSDCPDDPPPPGPDGPPPPKPKKPKFGLVRLDLGGGIIFGQANTDVRVPDPLESQDEDESSSTSQVRLWAEQDLDGIPALLPRVDLRLSFGPTHSFQFAVGLFPRTSLAFSNQAFSGYRLGHGSLIVGYAYQFGAGPKRSFEFAPRIGIGALIWDLEGLNTEVISPARDSSSSLVTASFALDVGASIRGFLAQGFGLFIDGGLTVSQPAEFSQRGSGASLELNQPTQGRITAGISLRFY